ncbi:Ig-like domain-containing protein [Gordonia sp. (in: high G+C Gram-positive bacteria)]|uniref:Ig-like domain-containing protein n=1 Tax=Gordonia sp. (in: high G+C Gram-positive bacteria) TaxID=84139 RepID=UPI0035290591
MLRKSASLSLTSKRLRYYCNRGSAQFCYSSRIRPPCGFGRCVELADLRMLRRYWISVTSNPSVYGGAVMRVSVKNKARLLAAATGVAMALSAEAGRAAAEPEEHGAETVTAPPADTSMEPASSSLDTDQSAERPSVGSGSPGAGPGSDPSLGADGSDDDGSTVPSADAVAPAPATGVDGVAGDVTVQLPGSAGDTPAAGDLGRGPASQAEGPLIVSGLDLGSIGVAPFRAPAAATTSIESSVSSLPTAPVGSRSLADGSRGGGLLGLGLLSSLVVPVSPLAPAGPAPLASWVSLLWWSGRSRNYLHNRAPQAAVPTVGYDRSTGEALGRLNATDPDGDRLSYRVSSGPSQGSVTVGDDGSFVYTPNADLRDSGGVDSFTVTISDESYPHIHGLHGLLDLLLIHKQHGHSVTETVIVRVDADNKDPVIERVDYQNALPNGTLNTPIVVSVRDPNPGDVVTVSVSGAAHGSVADLGGGVFIYTPDPVFRHEEGFTERLTVTADDGQGGSAVQVIEIVVEKSNQAPLITDVDYPAHLPNGVETAVISVSTEDPDGDEPIEVSVGGAVHGSVVRNADGTFTYTPVWAVRHEGGFTELLTVTADDGRGGVTTQSIAIVVAQANVTPVIESVSAPSIPNGTEAATIEVVTSDPDGDVVVVTVTGAEHGSVTQNPDGTFTYTPVWSFRHEQGYTETLLVTADDGHGGVVTQTVELEVQQANRLPVIEGVTAPSAMPNGTDSVTIQVVTSDLDGDQVVVTVADAAHGTVTRLADGTFSYTPTWSYRHEQAYTETLTVIADDGHGGVVQQTVTIAVEAANRPPVIESVTAPSVLPASAVNTGITVVASDPDGDQLDIVVVGAVSGTVTNSGNGVFVYTPDPDVRHVGGFTEMLTVYVSDGHGGSDVRQIAIEVAQSNEAPVIDDVVVAPPSLANGSDTATITVVTSDPDDDSLTVNMSAEHGSVTAIGGGVFVYTPDKSFRHEHPFTETVTIVADDGLGGRTTRVVTIEVAQSNTPPVIESVSAPSIPNGTEAATIEVVTSDPDGDVVVVTVTGAEHGSVTQNPDGTFTYTPVWSFRHEQGYTETLLVTADDGHGGVVNQTVSIVVDQTNRPPVIESVDAPPIGAGASNGVITVHTSDPDGDSVTIDVSGAAHGTITANGNGTFTYTPDPAQRHAGGFTETLTITIDDGHGGTTQQTVAMNVAQTNQAPLISHVDYPGAMPSGTTTATIAVTTSDPDGDTVTVSITGAQHGTVVRNANGTFTYTPDVDYRRGQGYTETLTVVADDGHGLTTTQVISIEVVKTAQPPVIDKVSIPSTLPAGTATATFTVTAHAPDGGPVTVEILGAKHGTIKDNGDGTFTYTPDGAYRHSQGYVESFTVRVTGNDGQATTSKVYWLGVEQTNTAPTITVEAPSRIPANTTNAVIVVHVADGDGDPLTTTVTTNYGGTVTNLGGGNYLYTPHAYNRTETSFNETITFTVNDGHGGSASQSVVIYVERVNGPPVIGNITYDDHLTETEAYSNIRIPTTDPDGDVVTVTLSGQQHGTFQLLGTDPNGTTYRYIPDPNYRKQSGYVETITVTATDPAGLSTTTTIVITVDQVVPIVTKYNVGDNPQGVALNATGTEIYVANMGGNTVTMIDRKTGRTVDVTVPAGPTSLLADASGTLYVTSIDKNGKGTVTAIDTGKAWTGQNPIIWSAAGPSYADGIALRDDGVNGRYLYVTGWDSGSSSPMTYQYDVAFNAPTPGKLVKKWKTGEHALVLSPDGKKAYTTSLVANIVYVANLDGTAPGTQTPIAITRYGSYPVDIVSNADGSLLFVSGFESDNIVIINTNYDLAVNAIALPAGSRPQGMAVAKSPDGSKTYLYVANSGNGTVSVIDTTSLRVVKTISGVGDQPHRIAVSPDGSLVYVTNYGDDTVTVINAWAI